MENNKIILSVGQMRQIARHEITFKDILGNVTFEDGAISCPDTYNFTLDDLHQAIKRLSTANPTILEFGEYWFYPITLLSEAFCLDRACGWESDCDDVPQAMKGYPGLIVSESSFFQERWLQLEIAWEEGEADSRLSEVLDFDAILADFDRYLGNKGKPIEEWVFPEEEMETYIRFFNNDKFIAKAEEAKLSLARKFIDELCAKDNSLALYTKGYASYGGNRLYPCNWNISRDCMIRLFEKEDDPNYANTLGYIYYYGRCNRGVPEYDKAFYYFGIAAANGIYEGLYKLADMYCHGYGCKESKGTAFRLYSIVYDDNLKQFLKGKNANFADAALRMGNVYAKGIGREIDIPAAYFYYLQAGYAAKVRTRDNYFGDATVVKNIRKATEEMKEQLPDDYFTEFVDYEFPFLFTKLASENNRCALSRSMNAEGRIELTAKRIPTKSVPKPDDILVTIPQLSFCARTVKASFTLDEDAKIWFRDKAEKVRFNFSGWNNVESRFEFFYDEKLVAWVRSANYRFVRAAKGKRRKG